MQYSAVQNSAVESTSNGTRTTGFAGDHAVVVVQRLLCQVCDMGKLASGR